MDLYAGEQLLLKSGSTVSAQEALAGKKVIALYFSAHWCPPCRQFTPLLRQAFQLANTTKSMVVFVSSDRSFQDQLSYMREAHGEWPAVIAGSQLAQRLGSQFGVRGIPALIVINASDGAVITKDGRRDVMSMGGAAFAHWESQASGVDDVDVSVVEKLKDNPDEVKKEAAEILLKLLQNVRRDPHNLKFRSIKLSNPKIESKLLTANGAFEILFSVGFEEAGDKLVLPLDVPMTTLEAFCNAVSQVVGVQSSGAPATSAPSAPATAAAAASAATPAQAGPSANRPLPPQAVNRLMSSLQNNLLRPYAPSTKAEHDFARQLLGERALVSAYEEKSAQEAALKVVPVKDLEDKAKAAFERARKADANVSQAMVRDLLILELLAWFKNDFFSWVDCPKCDACGGETARLQESEQLEPNEQERRDGANRVEGYHCDPCGKEVRFPRYHSLPAKLLETRRGRCGEWASCFALICRSIGYDVRHVCDWADHVWVEVWSEAEGRWVHADPCENAYDKPLMYEVGWGKKLAYVMATSKDETQDVTWRYSCDHDGLRARRRDTNQSGYVRPGWLVKTVLLMTKNAQEGLKCSEEEKKRLLKRRLMELVELMKEKDKAEASAEEQQGRHSGSLAWRAARSEVGGIEEEEKVIWRLKDCEKESGIFHLEYDIVEDRYIRRSAADEETKGWRAGAKESKDVFRKVEKDWKQCYLSRRAGTSKGSLTWEIDLSGTDLCVQSIELDVNSKTFESGRVVWQLCGGSTCLLPSPGSTLRSEGLAGATKVTLTAVVSGGQGDVAWQHAQLFRAHEKNDKGKVQLRILLKLTKA